MGVEAYHAKNYELTQYILAHTWSYQNFSQGSFMAYTWIRMKLLEGWNDLAMQHD